MVQIDECLHMYLLKKPPPSTRYKPSPAPQKAASCLFSVSNPPETTVPLLFPEISSSPVLKLHINSIIKHELLCGFLVQLCPLKPSTLCVAIIFFYWWVICHLWIYYNLLIQITAGRASELFPVWKLWIKLWTFFYMLLVNIHIYFSWECN